MERSAKSREALLGDLKTAGRATDALLSKIPVLGSIYDQVKGLIGNVIDIAKGIWGALKFVGNFAKNAFNFVGSIFGGGDKKEKKEKTGEKTGKFQEKQIQPNDKSLVLLGNIEELLREFRELKYSELTDEQKARKDALEGEKLRLIQARELAEEQKDSVSSGESFFGEDERESLFQKALPEFLGGFVNKHLGRLAGIVGGILGLVVAPVGVIIGAGEGIVGTFKAISRAFETIKEIKSVITGSTEILTKEAGPVKKFFVSIGEVFAKIKNFVSGGPVGKAISKALQFLKVASQKANLLSKFAGKMGWAIKLIGKFLGPMTSIFKFARVFGKFLGPIGVVITVIEGVWKTVSGFIEGFKEGGLLGGIKGGLKGFFGDFVGGFLDSLKDIAAWVLDLFGLDGIAQAMRDFSFKDLFTNLIENTFGLFQKMVDSVTNFINDAWNGRPKLLGGTGKGEMVRQRQESPNQKENQKPKKPNLVVVSGAE